MDFCQLILAVLRIYTDSRAATFSSASNVYVDGGAATGRNNLAVMFPSTQIAGSSKWLFGACDLSADVPLTIVTEVTVIYSSGTCSAYCSNAGYDFTSCSSTSGWTLATLQTVLATTPVPCGTNNIDIGLNVVNLLWNINNPTMAPTTPPSLAPATQSPSATPTIFPTKSPTFTPTTSTPSFVPTISPTMLPTGQPSSIPTGQPSSQPSTQPTSQPIARPSSQPSSQPTRRPSAQPSSRPSSQPSTQPTAQPSGQPVVYPTSRPTGQPSSSPTVQPSTEPSSRPSQQPTRQPTSTPSNQPTSRPTCQPTCQPSSRPSRQPTSIPSKQPTSQPTRRPTCQPSSQPSARPSVQPSSQPSGFPSMQPSSQPTRQPSTSPTSQPTIQPSGRPTTQPSSRPSAVPSSQPSITPTCQPTTQPSSQPSGIPSTQPSAQPTASPSNQPSDQPTSQPSSRPSVQPSSQPSGFPSMQPTCQPTSQPSGFPSYQPSSHPSTQPSSYPSPQPTSQPSSQPSGFPSMQPSSFPSSQPTGYPSSQPSGYPTSQPTSQPSCQPTGIPSSQPTSCPSCQPSAYPSSFPTSQPSEMPSSQPTMQPSSAPTTQPSALPSAQPTGFPTNQPSCSPTSQPSSAPSCQPSAFPTSLPSSQPSSFPTSQPTGSPSRQPTCQPTSFPSSQPSTQPSCQPSSRPSSLPSTQPTLHPSRQPTSQPSSQPSARPTEQPSSLPSSLPSSQPTSRPSAQPSNQPTSVPTGQPSWRPSAQPSSSPTFFPYTGGLLSRGLWVDGLQGYRWTQSRTPFKQVLFLFGTLTQSNLDPLANISLSFSSDHNLQSVGSSFVLLGSSFTPSLSLRTMNLSRPSPDLSVSVYELQQPSLLSVMQNNPRSIEMIADVNGDRRKDLLIGSPLQGMVFLLFGTPQHFQTGLQHRTVIIGGDDLNYFGWAVSSAGDFDGDRLNDLMISAMLSGKVYLLYGRRSFPATIRVADLNKNDMLLISGPKSTGMSLACAGDFNGDGVSDVAVSASTSDQSNVVYVIFGRRSRSSSLLLNNFNKLSLDGIRLVGAKGSFIGISLAGAGDTNGDSLEDLVVGSLPYQKGYTEQRAYLVYGRNVTSGRTIDLSSLSTGTGVDGFEMNGGGFMVAGIGDANNDGHSDFLVTGFDDWNGRNGIYLMVSPSDITSFPSSEPSVQPSSSPTSLNMTKSLRPSYRTSPPSSSTHPSRLPSPRPSRRPTSLRPSQIPSTSPSTSQPSLFVAPTSWPTVSFEDFVTIYIDGSGRFNGSENVRKEKFVIRPVNKTEVYSVAQVRYYQFLPVRQQNKVSRNKKIVTLNDYNPRKDYLDFSAYPSLVSVDDLAYTQPPVTFYLPDGVVVVCVGLDSFSDINSQNIIYSTDSGSSLASTSSYRSGSMMVPAVTAFVVLIGITLLLLRLDWVMELLVFLRLMDKSRLEEYKRKHLDLLGLRTRYHLHPHKKELSPQTPSRSEQPQILESQPAVVEEISDSNQGESSDENEMDFNSVDLDNDGDNANGKEDQNSSDEGSDSGSGTDSFSDLLWLVEDIDFPANVNEDIREVDINSEENNSDQQESSSSAYSSSDSSNRSY